MKKNLFALFFIAFMVFGALSLYAQSAREIIIVPGTPAVTLHDADCQIRLLEFVLKTRLTVAQKRFFLEQFKDECRDMTAEEKSDALSASELCDSLSFLSEEEAEDIRQDLEQGYIDGAKETIGAPASEFFLKLKNENTKVLLSAENVSVTLQSMQAFCEYLAFAANPDKPTFYSAKTVDFINGMMRGSFESLKPEEKAALDDFQLTWYMIRAAWQNMPEGEIKNSWKRKLALCGLKPKELPTLSNIRAALSDDVYGTMLDKASNIGAEPYEWSVGLSARVW